MTLEKASGMMPPWRLFLGLFFSFFCSRFVSQQARQSLGSPRRSLLKEKMGMTKSELVQRIVDRNPHLSHRDVERIVSVVFDGIADALAGGNRVELRRFGTFSVRYRGARDARNPRTGEPVGVDAKHIPFFKAGKRLRERLNEE